MNAPLIVLVTGLPATGKSTLAQSIAQRLRCPLIAKDAIKEPLLKLPGTGGRAWSRRLSDVSFAVMFAIARQLGIAAVPFVLEGNFRPGEHETALRPLAAEGQLVQVLCVVPEALRLRRLAERVSDLARHPGHADAALALEPPGACGFLELPGRRIEHDGACGDAGRATILRVTRGDS